MMNDCFALLDDGTAGTAAATSRLYTDYRRRLTGDYASDLPRLFNEMQKALQQGLHAVALLSYELGDQMHDIAPRPAAAHPLAEILLFAQCRQLNPMEVSDWLASHSAPPSTTPSAGITRPQASIDEAEFAEALARIHSYIEAGDTYQINFTYRLRFDAYGDPLTLYTRLRQRQPAPYGALILLPDGRAVLSHSPELFARHSDGDLTAQPMKGTAAASDDEVLNRQHATALATDAKNRAENLMIVDLLRNDLGRIAVPGSVEVTKLFEVNRFSQVLQMTSTIHARLRDDVDLPHLITALYPCGSITGAPKRRSMQIIRELESTPRGLYTGAIGWFDAAPDGRRVGDFCLSVAIRSLHLDAPSGGMRRGEIGIGAGIVYDSVTKDEYAECQLKAEFLTGIATDFSLFETIHASRKNGCRHLERHLKRLSDSAQRFDFHFDEAKLRLTLQQACADLATSEPYRLRVTLQADGEIDLHSAWLSELDEPVQLFIAPDNTDAADVFLQHKTTVRGLYDASWREAERRGGFDMLFFNRDGYLTEGGRSNVFIQLEGVWCTPPLEAGVLPGIMRSVILADSVWQAQERMLTRDDLQRAQQVVVCNALRGVLRAEVVWD
ncbi:aminodeoxychorismate synthase component I [Herbaspirillum sp. RTI4]|uniref:aminodeoxychorismate synthase component I n=1 Tax=Herbaspirillum sp. RTI4 TaxID=3048640 RepID=UPI002AB5B831|nr:aminodeoxychorismate synthase component I [Herbaspirillum sp. RTI4]MDY7579819.1 aminodeoxychorismate synthase component I [Herbaspirillum sp. RTI4]MEA9981906.1 aminodeoxychorismate synthase component I [Herbaspirillum sp. RTI4]